MRNMSFALTTEQVRAGTKTITRRLGWADLKPGEQFMAVEKGQGIPKGGKVQRIRACVCVSNRREKLIRLLGNADYARKELRREGFPELSAGEFVALFCKANNCTPRQVVNRIEFTYIYA